MNNLMRTAPGGAAISRTDQLNRYSLYRDNSEGQAADVADVGAVVDVRVGQVDFVAHRVDRHPILVEHVGWQAENVRAKLLSTATTAGANVAPPSLEMETLTVESVIPQATPPPAAENWQLNPTFDM